MMTLTLASLAAYHDGGVREASRHCVNAAADAARKLVADAAIQCV